MTVTILTYSDRTGHNPGCVREAAAILAATGDFDGLALTGRQQEDAAVDALTDLDIECRCDLYRTDLVESITTDPEPEPAPTLTIYVSAYGGWNFDQTSAAGAAVTFTTDAVGAAYVASHGHLAIWHDEDAAGDWDAFPLTFDALHPTCEHGMSASNCYGPDHFMSAAQERAMGW